MDEEELRRVRRKKNDIRNLFEDLESKNWNEQGEKKLIRAVLVRALHDWHNVLSNRTTLDHANIAKLRKWLMLDNPLEPLSFSWCCEALDLPTKEVRNIAIKGLFNNAHLKKVTGKYPEWKNGTEG